MGLRVVEIDTYMPGAQTSASLQIATFKDKFSFQHLWRHCVGAGTSQRESAGVVRGSALCEWGRWALQSPQSRRAMKRANRTSFFVAGFFNLWLFWANKFYSVNIMFVLTTAVEIIVKNLFFSVLPSMPLLHEIFNYVCFLCWRILH